MSTNGGPMFGKNFLIKPDEALKKKIIDSVHIQAQFPGNQSRRILGSGKAETQSTARCNRSNSLYKSLRVYLELNGYGTGWNKNYCLQSLVCYRCLFIAIDYVLPLPEFHLQTSGQLEYYHQTIAQISHSYIICTNSGNSTF